MSRKGTHQTCPCGSGRDYTDCCAKTYDLADYRANILERETEQFLDKVWQKFAAEWFEQVPTILIDLLGLSLHKVPAIAMQMENLFDEQLEGPEGAVLDLLNECILFDYPIHEESTVFKQYFAKELKKLRPLVAESVAQWVDSYVSVYEVHAIDQYALIGMLKDVFTGESYPTDLRALTAVFDLEEGDLLVCRRLPKGEISDIACFFLIFGGLQGDLIQRVSQFKEVHFGGGDENWPQFLKKYGAEVVVTAYELFEETLVSFYDDLYNLEEKLTWANEKQHEVAKMIRACLTEDDYSLEEACMAISIWYQFCEKRNPRITKMEVMVAAIEYFVNQELGGMATQKELGEKYGVSPATISARFREIYESVVGEVLVNSDPWGK